LLLHAISTRTLLPTITHQQTSYHKSIATTPTTPTASKATAFFSLISFAPPVVPVLTIDVFGVDEPVAVPVSVGVGVGVAGGIVFTIFVEAVVEQTGFSTRLVRLGQAERAELSCNWWAL
jgi:hypothetical protein